MNKIDKALSLTNQLLEAAVEQDRHHRQRAIYESKGSQAIGNSFMVFHLTKLKELLEENEEN